MTPTWREELKQLGRHSGLAVRVLAGALAVWVPWTAIRFVVCWSVPFIQKGSLSDVLAECPPCMLFLLFPFAVELLIAGNYLFNACLDDKLGLDDIPQGELNSIREQDTDVLRYRLVRPGIVTFVAHFACMPFSPAAGIAFSWIPWALSFIWWELPWYSFGTPEEYRGIFSRRFVRTTERPDGMLSGEEAQARLDALSRDWEGQRERTFNA